MKLIDKDAVMAIIEKRKQRIYPKRTDYTDGQKSELVNLSLEINNLEVKDVDEQQERMNECPYRQVGCAMYEGHVLECTGACSWVVDYPKLKELKAQKGEKV